jgi:hypothetical protein
MPISKIFSGGRIMNRLSTRFGQTLACIVFVTDAWLGGLAARAQQPASKSAEMPAKDAVDKNQAKTGAAQLTGTWLFTEALYNGQSQIGEVWDSRVTISGNRFSLSKFLGSSHDFSGRFVLDESANPKSVDQSVGRDPKRHWLDQCLCPV